MSKRLSTSASGCEILCGLEASAVGRLPCPNCGQPAALVECSGVATEPHGETHEDVWLECSECGARTDETELSAANRDDEATAFLPEVA